MRARHHWKPWDEAEERRLVELAASGAEADAIARDLDRTVNAIRNRAVRLGISLAARHRRRRRPSPATRPRRIPIN
jgi:hypothetical protein